MDLREAAGSGGGAGAGGGLAAYLGTSIPCFGGDGAGATAAPAARPTAPAAATGAPLVNSFCFFVGGEGDRGVGLLLDEKLLDGGEGDREEGVRLLEGGNEYDGVRLLDGGKEEDGVRLLDGVREDGVRLLDGGVEEGVRLLDSDREDGLLDGGGEGDRDGGNEEDGERLLAGVNEEDAAGAGIPEAFPVEPPPFMIS